MYSKMFSSDAQPSINSYDSDDSGEDSISAGQLEEYRELYLEKFWYIIFITQSARM